MTTLYNGKPVDDLKEVTLGAAPAPAPAKPSATHHPDCGIVGETGVHGDLGSNARSMRRTANRRECI